MDAKHLAALQERLLLGEYTTQDLHDAARCAAAWATLEKWVQSSSTLVEIIGYRGREHPWAVYPTRSSNQRYTGPTAIEAVEAAPEVGP